MKLDGVRQKVFLDRYSLKDKKGNPTEQTPDEMWKRVAKGVAKAEKKKDRALWQKKFYEAMKDFKFVPGGRILAGAGTGFDVTFYNCFVLPSPQDSRDGILDNLKGMIEIMARGGGAGINLSSLRPRGARVKKVNGFSSGPCNWAELYSLATKDIIQQGGSRRGALMLMLWDWHPDIEEFITVKQDLKRINGANLSVCVSDKFMEAVKKDANWDLVFPDTQDKDYDEKWDGVLNNWIKAKKKVKVHKTIKARYLWNLICEAAWRSAEPGIVFMERYNKWYNNWYWNTVNCTNPCVTGDTLVTVENGFKKTRDLKAGDKILTPNGFKPIKKFYNNGKQLIYKVSFSDGGNLRATKDHKLRVIKTNGKQEWIKVIDLQKGDKILKLFFLGATDKTWQSNKNNYNQNEKYNNHKKQISAQKISHSFALLANDKLTSQKKDAIVLHNNILSQASLSNPTISGGTIATPRTTCPMSAVISDNFLSSDFVKSSLPKNDKSFLLNSDSIVADQGIKISFVEVENVENTKISEEVFDVYEPETLTWVTNGYVSLDCGEEGLPSWGVCNLSSLNLSAFVKGYSVEKAGEMDYKSLSEHAKIGVRLQDDVIDIDSYVFPEIRQMQFNGERRIGLGTMGLGDALIKMHLRYGSDESLKVIEKIFKTIRDAAYEASVEIAREKGAFPKFVASKYTQGYFIKKLPKELREKIKKYGTRNSLLLQEAPTGSTSLLAGVSSGIEPIYEFEFIRRDRLGEHKILHPLYEEWKKVRPNDPKPDYFVSANDLIPQDHVKVQSRIQQYVDASISKTVNAPNIHTVADVKKLYELAYDLGCKGITYMREGSREGVLTRVDDKKEVKEEVKPAKVQKPVVPRPMQLEGVTYKIQTPVGGTYITINHNQDKEPFEVFITLGKSGSDVAAMADALGRMISLNLRFNDSVSPREKIRQIVSQLAGIGGARSVGFGKEKVRSLPDAVAKVLATHFGFVVNGKVEDNPQVLNGHAKQAPSALQQSSLQQSSGQAGQAEKNGDLKIEVEKPIETDVVVMQQLTLEQESGLSSATGLFDICPECGSGSLAYEEGCRKCYSCGYSEC
ncbi:MAG: ribonucleoside-diphosphate reductase, adenosylcobalamin-dependent [Patescibacteria group bacterium]|nr:ribonucleoside-diphosphate reductase, adenosylcobalamin-dependent [Patescibacteria group bacterium]